MRQWIPRIAGIVAVIFLFLFPFIYTRADYDFIMHLWIVAFFYAIMASSWSLLAGYAGQFSFGHMAFMAIGAYGAALYGNYIRITSAPTNLCREYAFGSKWLVFLNPTGVTSSKENCLDLARATFPAGTVIAQPSVWWGILLGVLFGALFGLIVGYLVLRLRSTYLALFTIGFAEILRAAISAEINITQGLAGLELAPLFPHGITILGTAYSSTDKLPPYYAHLFLFLICMGILGWLASSRFGLFIRAIREDEEAAAALGVNVVRYKVLVFVVTATMAAAVGAIQGHYIGIITPNLLLILFMSLVIAMAVIGGLESFVAAAVGAIIIEFMLELLRNSFTIGSFTIDMTTWRLVAFGALLMLTLRFRRNGLIHPILNYFSRAGVAEETVAKRQAATAGVAENGGSS